MENLDVLFEKGDQVAGRSGVMTTDCDERVEKKRGAKARGKALLSDSD